MSGLDPIFSAEDRLVAISLSRSRLMQMYLSRWKFRDIGIALSVLLVILGFKTASSKESRSAQQLAFASASSISRLLRSASEQFLRSSSLYSEKDDVAVRRSPDVEARGPAADDNIARSNVLVRIAEFSRHRLDACLLGFLSYKLMLLVMFTMPVSYGFGLKRQFLNWASRATAFRIFLRFGPLMTLSLVGAASVSVRFSKHPVGHLVARRWQMLGFLNIIMTYCTSRLFELIRGNPEPYIRCEETADDRDLLNANPPELWQEGLVSLPLRKICPPVFLGLDELPKHRRRLLFVGNHNIWALDTALLTHGLRERTGIWLRPLGEHSWFALPIVGEIVRSFGAVDGTRHNCDILMEKGENILVYPGGARESWKRTTDEKYALLWGDHHLGFVAMAVRHGYSIVPVVSVGAEDVFEPFVDVPIDRVLTLGGLIPRPPSGTSKAFDHDAKVPMVRPRFQKAQRIYFRFMEAIDTAEFKGQEDDEELLRSLRDETKARLLQGVKDVMTYRQSDPDRFTFVMNTHERAKL